ncbi:G-protein-signaling modulator 1 [Aphelenchoides fujianensis]|nr:G-protein-signaling modulator 1 [Aphelenchoides fujianensis]
MHPLSLCPRRNSTIFSGGKTMGGDSVSEDHLYELIMSSQRERMDDQRSELGGRPQSCSDLPDEVTDLVFTMQASRYENQRAFLKPPCASDSDLLNVGGGGASGGESPQQRCASAVPNLAVGE